MHRQIFYVHILMRICLTLSKNKKSGEYKYIFTTANGSSEDSFGSIYSASTDESTGILKITPEFSYVDFIETDDDIHQVKGQDTTKENYDKLTGMKDALEKYIEGLHLKTEAVYFDFDPMNTF